MNSTCEEGRTRRRWLLGKKSTNVMGYLEKRSRTGHKMKSPRYQEEGVALLCIEHDGTVYLVGCLNAQVGMLSWKGSSRAIAGSFPSFPSVSSWHFDLLHLHTALFPRLLISMCNGDRLEERSSTLHRDLYDGIDGLSLSFERYRWIGPSRHFGV